MTYDPQEYWERRAVSGGAFDDTPALFSSLRDWIYTHASPADTFLEVGSGTGRVYRATQIVYYYACDIAPTYADQCYDNTGVSPIIWDGVTLPYGDNTFDWVISFSVLLHVEPENIAHFVAEHLRVAKSYVFVSTYTGQSKDLAAHCFKHDYDSLFKGVRVKEQRHFADLSNTQWLLQRRNG